MNSVPRIAASISLVLFCLVAIGFVFSSETKTGLASPALQTTQPPPGPPVLDPPADPAPAPDYDLFLPIVNSVKVVDSDPVGAATPTSVSTGGPASGNSPTATSTPTETPTETPTPAETNGNNPAITSTPTSAPQTGTTPTAMPTSAVTSTWTPDAVTTQNPSAPTTETLSPTPSPISTTIPATAPTMVPTTIPTTVPTSGADTPTPTPDDEPVDNPQTPTPPQTPSPTPAPVLTGCAADLVAAAAQSDSVAAQIGVVEEDAACLQPFVDLLLANPLDHVDAFYAMIHSSAVTNDLWAATFNMVNRGEFRTTAAGVENMWVNLENAIDQCSDGYRCGDWETFILPHLYVGGMYRCPDFATDDLTADELINSAPYGGYYCIEDLAYTLAAVVDEASLQRLIALGTTLDQDWSRRNVLRILGRLAQQPAESTANSLMTDTLREPVTALLLDRLENERSAYVLNDAIWVLDSFYYPMEEAQLGLQQLTADTALDSAVRFRAMNAIARLMDQKTSLSESDLAFLEASLVSDEAWVRANAAFALRVVEDILPDPVEGEDEPTQRSTIIALLEAAYEVETVLTAKVPMANALDAYTGTTLRAALQTDYEDTNLASELTFNHISIRGGLPQEELPAFMVRMQQTEAIFFDLLGPPFDTPVPNDPTDAMTLILFATRADYREYMSAFVGYGSEAGGLYLEGEGKLYTYQRLPSESAFSVEQLVQHEFVHYLQGRHIFPGLWTDPGYHTEAKGWVDEGTAEFFGQTQISSSGSATFPLPSTRLNAICGGQSYASLSALLTRRVGYDQPGVFDYDHGWAFIYYLMSKQKGIGLDLYRSLRDGSYQFANFANIASASIPELEQDWHQTLDGWCSNNLVQAASQTPPSVSTEIVQISNGSAAPQPPVLFPAEQDGQIVRLVGE